MYDYMVYLQRSGSHALRATARVKNQQQQLGSDL